MENNLNSNSYIGNGIELKTNFINSSILEVSQLVKYFEDELKDLYWAEKTLTKFIPSMISNATSMDLKVILTTHLVETNQQIERLIQVFASINRNPIAIKCEIMEGLIINATNMMKSYEVGEECDAKIILAAQKMKNYELVTYGKLHKLAEKLVLSEAVRLINATLEEEKAAIIKLKEIAIAANYIESRN